MRRSFSLSAIAVGLTLIATPALADRIDGDWCNGASTYHIDGPAIRIPSGKDMTGDYTRHSFHYISPAGEKDAGTEIFMRILSEEDMQLMRRTGLTESPIENWQRCKPVS